MVGFTYLEAHVCVVIALELDLVRDAGLVPISEPDAVGFDEKGIGVED